MSELLGRLIIVSLAWAGIIHVLIQMKQIVIRHRLIGLLSRKSVQLAVAFILITLAILFELPLIDWIVVFSAALFVYVSQFNKGLTSKGVIPIESGTAIRGMMSKEYNFNETQEWLFIDQEDRIQLCFTTVKEPDDIKLIYFDKTVKEQVLSYLSQKNQKVRVTKDK